MHRSHLRRLTGFLFIAGALLINVPYMLLISSFDYPDILRQPAEHILTQFAAGGTSLIAQWFAFAWVGLPLLLAMLLLPKALGLEASAAMTTATMAGVVAAIAQMVGLLRWVFVVPVLSRLFADPAAGEATRQAVVVAFRVVHQFGGVLLGEHVGQLFTILWMGLVSLARLRSSVVKAWLGWLGIVASAIYLAAQTELLATVVPAFPAVPQAGLVGSLLWLGWMLVLGITLAARSADMSPSPTTAAGVSGHSARTRGI